MVVLAFDQLQSTNLHVYGRNGTRNISK